MNAYKACCLVVQTALLVGLLPYKMVTSFFFPQTPKKFSSVLITGASTGIGAEMARQYASEGAHLTLVDRRADKLSEVKLQCEALGAVVRTILLDVTDKGRMREAVCEADDEYPLDLVIANAGVAGTTLFQKNDNILSDVSSMVTSVNVLGVCNTLSPALERMRTRQYGQLVITSSYLGVLGWSGDPLTFSYVSSKIWACTYGAALRSILQRENIGVSVLCPGAIKTEMLADMKSVGHDFGKGLAADCEAAVKQMLRGIADNVGMICVKVSLAQRLLSNMFGYNLIPPFLWNEIAPLSDKSNFNKSCLIKND